MSLASGPACPVTVDRPTQGFTLLEIVIVMVIISVLAVMAMPVVSSMMREAAMREPVERLEELAKAVRLRSMLEGYPYEIIFTADGFEGRRFQLRKEGEEEVEESEDGAKEAEGLAAAESEAGAEQDSDMPASEDGEEPAPALVLPDLEAYKFSGTMACRLLFWGRTQWIEAPQVDEKELIPVQNRWLFQPTGLCNPVTVQFHRDDMWVEVAFNPLTGDIQSERSMIP